MNTHLFSFIIARTPFLKGIILMVLCIGAFLTTYFTIPNHSLGTHHSFNNHYLVHSTQQNISLHDEMLLHTGCIFEEEYLKDSDEKSLLYSPYILFTYHAWATKLLLFSILLLLFLHRIVLHHIPFDLYILFSSLRLPPSH